MNKASKGALAIGTAGFLLLGGAGSLAYWTAQGTVNGTDISSGHISLGDPSCVGWKLDGGTPFTSETRIVPGDSITQVCTFTISASGDHLKATFAADPGTLTGKLASGLNLDSTFTYDNAEFDGQPVTVTDGKKVVADLKVTFTDSGEDNTTQGLDAALDAITVSATQAH
jgi:alternate signal-mediated exported protein